ncbi:MAG TPA: glycosyltransferase family 9 protein [Casimicrobiaceae bacterium]|nr:glycosyltransferase family 9 protein [Casimicrobiaceae bacterium]
MTARTTADSALRIASPRAAPPACDAQPLPAREVRVLIVKRDKLGDLLLTTPVLAHLAARLPHAEIHLLANDYNAWVVRTHPALARTWCYSRARDGGRLRIVAAVSQLPMLVQLRRQRFDWAIVMNGEESHRGIRRAIASGASRVVAYAETPSRYGSSLTDPIPPPTEGHETTRMLALLAPLGLAKRQATIDAPSFELPDDSRAFARAWLSSRGLHPRAYAVVGVGARRAKKQPTPAQVVRWARWFHGAHGLPTVFMWTPGDARNPAYPGDDSLAAEIVREALPFVHPFRGPIHEALGLIFEARTSVMPDSGLMHFAAASDGGVLGLFADPTDSAPASRWAPLGPRGRYVEAQRCVAELADEVVFEAIAPLLEKAKTG